MRSMDSYPKAEMERAMKVQDVMLQAMAKKITWWQAAEILGISDRHMRRWRERYEEEGYNGLMDRRRGKPSHRRVPLATVEKVFALYREKYFDMNVQHFHEKLEAEHGIELSYTWVKQALQGAGLVARGRKRGVHRKRRERRPLPGMLLHIDGSRHQWVPDGRMWNDGTGQSVFARALCGRVQPAFSGSGGAARKRFCALPEPRSESGVLGAERAHGESRQHGEFPESVVATRTGGLESHLGGLPSDSASASGRHAEPHPRAAGAGTLRRAGRGPGEGDHAAAKSCGKDAGWKSQKDDFPTPLGNPAKCAGFPLSHSSGDGWLSFYTLPFMG